MGLSLGYFKRGIKSAFCRRSLLDNETSTLVKTTFLSLNFLNKTFWEFSLYKSEGQVTLRERFEIIKVVIKV